MKTNFLVFLALKDKSFCFLLLAELLRVFHYCFFGCFYFHHCFSGVFIVNCIFSCHKPWLLFCSFFVRYFVFVLLYHECYGFERSFFTLRCFLPYTPSPHLPQYHECYGFERDLFTLRRFLPYTPSRHLAQKDVAPTCFQGFRGTWPFMKV